MTSATSKTVFMFKISLKNSKPEVWRRVLVPGDYTFKDLHDVIIQVMGWSDFHMHKFTMKHPVTDKEVEFGGVGDLGYDDYLWLPESSKIAHYFITPKQKAIHEYDFGSPWYHIILFEKTLPAESGEKYPQCVGGKRATPPEEDPDSDYSEFEPDADDFDPELVNFDKCKQSEITHQSMSARESVQEKNFNQLPGQPAFNAEPLTETEKEMDESTELGNNLEEPNANSDIKSQSILPSKRRLVHLEFPSIAPQKVQCAESSPCAATSKEVNDVNGSTDKTIPIQISSIMSRMDSDIDEDIEDSYGKYVASQMRLISDLEAREELRIEIQKAIKKYRFKKR